MRFAHGARRAFAEHADAFARYAAALVMVLGSITILVSANGQVSRVRVRDMTRVAQALIVGLAALGTCLLVARANSRKEPQP